MSRPLLLTLLVCLRVSAGEPYATPEQALAPYTTGAAIGEKSRPLVASNGEDFMVVWSDMRRDRQSAYAMRIDSAGRMLDPEPRLVLDYAALGAARLWWDGSEYVLSSVYETQIRSYFQVRIPEEGAVSVSTLDRQAPSEWPKNASGESLLAFADDTLLRLVFEDADGGRRAWSVPHLPNVQVRHAVPLVNGDWVVVFVDSRGAHWMRVRKDEGVVETKFLLVRTGGRTVRIVTATSGESSAAMTVDITPGWERYERTYQETLTWAFLDSAGRLTRGSVGSQDPPFKADHGVLHPEIAATANAGEFHFAYTHFRKGVGELRAIRITNGRADVTTVDGVWERGWALETSPSMASSATRNLLVWAQPCGFVERGCQLGMRLFEIGGSAGDVPTERVAPAAIVRQVAPAVTAGSVGLLTAWRDEDERSFVQARFWPYDGTPSKPFPVSDPVDFGVRTIQGPKVAATKDGFVVAWLERQFFGPRGAYMPSSSVMVRRYSAHGEPVDAAPHRIDLTVAVNAFDVALRGDSFQLVWVSWPDAIFTVNLPATGAPGPIIPVSPHVSGMLTVDVGATTTGNETIAVWSQFDPGSEDHSIWAARISAAGTIGPAVPLGLGRLERGVRIAANESEFVVGAISRTERCLEVRRFDFAFTPVGKATLFCGELRGSDPGAFSWDGKRWWFVPQRPFGTATAAHVLNDDGTLGPSIQLVDPDVTALDPSLVRTATGLAVVYRRHDLQAGSVSRVFLRMITDIRRARSVRH